MKTWCLVMKYPFILFFRHESYSEIDTFLDEHKDSLDCTITITSDTKKLFNSSYQLLITYGKQEEYQCIDVSRFRFRWIHFETLTDLAAFNQGTNFCFVHNALASRETTRPAFSVFITCYDSYERFRRPFNSLKNQTFLDWECVVVDDSPDDKHFEFLRDLVKDEPQFRIYRRAQNSGNIGNVKNEAASLCRGKYILELDHDDEILPDCLGDAVKVFESDPEVGFVYMDCCHLYENGQAHSYGDLFGLGYAGYYRQKVRGRWVNTIAHPNINNITCSHIVAVPNHPRIWRRETLMKMGNYSEFLPICDDLELLLRTVVSTKMARVHKLAYIQYMNNDSNNFSLIRSQEINRLCRKNIVPQAFADFKVDERMRELGAHEDPEVDWWKKPIWKREGFEYKYCNKVINLDHTKQYAYIGFKTFWDHRENIRVLLENPKNDVFVLDNSSTNDELCGVMDLLKLDRIKCYSMKDCTLDQMRTYFILICMSCSDFEITGSSDNTPRRTSSEQEAQLHSAGSENEASDQ